MTDPTAAARTGRRAAFATLLAALTEASERQQSVVAALPVWHPDTGAERHLAAWLLAQLYDLARVDLDTGRWRVPPGFTPLTLIHSGGPAVAITHPDLEV